MRSDEKNMAAMVSIALLLPVGKEERGFHQIIRSRVCDPLLSCTIVDVEVIVSN
jgi:hypothetical protein